MADSHKWVDLWRRVADEDTRGDRRLIGDVCDGIDLVTGDGGPHDPDEVIAVAITGAIAAEATAAGLDREWALYTPQQGAVVASALYAQIEAAGAALEHLAAYLHVMDERRDVVLPELNDPVNPSLNEAEMAAGTAGGEVRAATHDAEQVVQLLAQAPYLGRQPAHCHETLTTVADLLGEAATLDTGPCACDVEEGDAGDRGCGCFVVITDAGGVVWQFQRVDGSWSLWKSNDVADGVLSDWVELTASGARAHPGHIASLIRQEVRLPLAQPA